MSVTPCSVNVTKTLIFQNTKAKIPFHLIPTKKNQENEEIDYNYLRRSLKFTLSADTKIFPSKGTMINWLSHISKYFRKKILWIFQINSYFYSGKNDKLEKFHAYWSEWISIKSSWSVTLHIISHSHHWWRWLFEHHNTLFI